MPTQTARDTEDEVVAYVQRHARHMARSRLAPYFVRYPEPYSPTVYTSDDPRGLVTEIMRGHFPGVPYEP